ncbi:MAG: oxidoreductase [Cyanobacteria bacterium RYN_339]|nr:oxidoreductase [Cyanobacteria bacterium RYN_339]
MYTPTPQAPLPSGFGPKTTAEEALAGRDLTGKVAIVTGGYSGIGLETTRVLANAGATVIVPARTPDKAREALGGIPRVEQESLDLADPASIDAFAARFVASGRPLHLLINNAGIMANPLTRDARGYESQFATNHLGHFQLTARLWPALTAAHGARVVSVSSRATHRGGVDFEDPNFEHRPYDKFVAYAQSKSANVLFAVALDRRGAAHGVRAFALHPGGILTDLIRFMSEEDLQRVGVTKGADGQLSLPAGDAYKTIEQGAATTVWCAVSPQLEGMGGVYCEDVDIAVPIAADTEGVVGVRPWAIDPELAERLWALSERLTGVEFKP